MLQFVFSILDIDFVQEHLAHFDKLELSESIVSVGFGHFKLAGGKHVLEVLDSDIRHELHGS